MRKNPKRLKERKIILKWTVRVLGFIVAIPLLALLADLCVLAYRSYRDWMHPEGVEAYYKYRRPELYEIPDTIIDGAAPDDVYAEIPLQNLPIRDLSYREIIDLFGTESVEGKSYVMTANSFPSSWESFPRIIEEKCDSLSKKNITEVRLRYNDGSRDYLILWVYEDDDDMQILWGVRVNEQTSLLQTTIYRDE